MCPGTAQCLGALLPLQYQLDFKRNELTDLGTTGTLREALTWHKDLLATLRRFDEPEAAFVVPGLDSAFEAHRCSNRGLTSELNGRGEDRRWG